MDGYNPAAPQGTHNAAAAPHEGVEAAEVRVLRHTASCFGPDSDFSLLCLFFYPGLVS